MSKADWLFLKTTNSILKDGSWDTKDKVRPTWDDGTPAHTAKVFAVQNKYKLSEEFPIISLRNINWRGAIDEVLWIWQKKSNNIHDLHSHIWDQWADKNGSIGKAYGYQAGQKAKYDFGEVDQIDMVRYRLKNTPAHRGIITELFVHKDLSDMGLYPCVHHMQFDVTDGKLNLFLKQRSNDTLAANSWNVAQYAALVEMLAQEANLKPGILCHDIVNSHIYDRHIPYVVDLTLSRAEHILKKLENVNDLDLSAIDANEKEALVAKAYAKEYDKDSFAKELENAKEIEADCAKYNTDFYELYAKQVVSTTAYKQSEDVINLMLKYPNLDKAFGFRAPRLVLDKNIKNFYDFKTPLMTNEQGKFVPSPDSSFNVVDYHPEIEGIKLQTKVPVAE